MKILNLILMLALECLADEAADIAAALNVSEAMWLTCRNITYQPQLKTPIVMAGIEASMVTYTYQAILGYVLANSNYTAAVNATTLPSQFDKITTLVTSLSSDMNWYFKHILKY